MDKHTAKPPQPNTIRSSVCVRDCVVCDDKTAAQPREQRGGTHSGTKEKVWQLGMRQWGNLEAEPVGLAMHHSNVDPAWRALHRFSA